MLKMNERLESDWTETNGSDWGNDEPTNERVIDSRLFGTIQVPPHVPLTLPDIYYYINYETHKTTNPPSPKEKWVAVTCAFIRYSSDYKPCFGDMGVKDGVEGEGCGGCRVRVWCREFGVHLSRFPESKHMFYQLHNMDNIIIPHK